MPDNPWLASDRQIAFRAVIHKSDTPWTSTTGNRYPILTVTQDNVVLYTVNEQNGGEGIPLGSTVAASYMMELDNSDKAYTPAMFTNCRVTAHIGISEDGTNITWVPFGVWFVDSVSAPEQSAIITLTGLDALSILFDKPYSLPTGHVYTFGQIASMICGKLNVPLVSDTFSGYDNDFDLTGGTDALPASSDSATYRNLIGYFAAAAGGYARMTKDGQLSIESYVRENVPLHELTPSQYFEYTPTGVEPFYFNRLQADHWMYDPSTEDMQVTRTDVYVNKNIDPSANTTIQMSAPTIKLQINPIFVADYLRSLTSESASIRFMGDPACQIGDRYRITDLDGSIHEIIGLAQSITYNGGLSMSVECNLPSSMQTQSLSYNTVRPFVNAYGQIVTSYDISGEDGIDIDYEPDMGYISAQPVDASINAGGTAEFSVTIGAGHELDFDRGFEWEWLAADDTTGSYSTDFSTLVYAGLITGYSGGANDIELTGVSSLMNNYKIRCKAYFSDTHVETSGAAYLYVTGTIRDIATDGSQYIEEETPNPRVLTVGQMTAIYTFPYIEYVIPYYHYYWFYRTSSTAAWQPVDYSDNTIASYSQGTAGYSLLITPASTAINGYQFSLVFQLNGSYYYGQTTTVICNN